MKKLLSISIILIMISVLNGCSSAGAYYKDGKTSFEKGKYEAAASSFSKAIEKNPNRADYYIDYGMTLIALGKYEDALTQFDKAYMNKDMQIIRENNKRVHRGKGITYYRMQQYEDAVNEFQKAISIRELSSLDMDILYYMGSSLRLIGSYDKAIEIYTSILKADPKNAGAFGNRALCYQNTGDYKKSLADYNTALKLDSDNYEYYFGKYSLLMGNGDKAGAGDALEKAAAIRVKTKEDQYNLAKIHYLQEDYEKALTELDASFKDGFTEANYFIGEIYRQQKDYSEAIFYYEDYIKNSSIIMPVVYNQVAACLLITGDSQKALDYLETGITRNDPGTIQSLQRNEIIAYEKLGEYDTAKEKLENYVISYPEDKSAIREAEFITLLNTPFQ